MISALEQDSSPIRNTSFFPNPVVNTTFVPSLPPQAVSPVIILTPNTPATNTAVILHLFLKNIAFPTFSKSLNSDYTLFFSSVPCFLGSSENSKNSKDTKMRAEMIHTHFLIILFLTIPNLLSVITRSHGSSP